MTEKILRDFSKEQNQEGRDALAAEIKETRRERFARADDLEERKTEKDVSIEQGDEQLGVLRERLEYLEGSFFSKVCRFVEISKLARDIEVQGQKLGIARGESKRYERQLEELSMRNGVVPEDFRESKRAIERFYDEEKEKYLSSEHDEEEIRKQFNVENLEGTSLEDYVLLLKKFGPEMVTHVTRQGVRDHFEFYEHSVGIGEASNGFKDMLDSRDLKHHLEIRVLSREKEEALVDFFHLKTRTKEEVLYRVDEFTKPENQHFGGSYVDFHGPHFAVRWVADKFYGSESGNEIFLAYSSHVIPANFLHTKDPYVGDLGALQNDLWTYVAENQRMPIDAGIVFIREDADVDPETGSIYEIDENGLGVRNTGLSDKINAVVQSETFDQVLNLALDKLGHLRVDVSREEREAFEELKEEIKGMLDGDAYLAEIFTDYDFLSKLKLYRGEEMYRGHYDIAVRSRMSQMRDAYKKPEKTISSKAYWEKYFSDNPEKRPSKLVYYQGADPNRALHQWMVDVGVSKHDEAKVALRDGFVDLYQKEMPAEILEEMSRFRSVALEVVEKFYAQQDA